LEDALLKGFEALRPSNGLGRAPRGGSGEEKILEDALLKGFQAVRPSNGLGRAPRGGSGGREDLGFMRFS